MVNLEEKYGRVVEAVPVGANGSSTSGPTGTTIGSRLTTTPSSARAAPASGGQAMVGRIGFGFGFGSGRHAGPTVVDQTSLISDGYVLNRLRGPVHDLCSTVSVDACVDGLSVRANASSLLRRPRLTFRTFCLAASPRRRTTPVTLRRASRRRHLTPRSPFNTFTFLATYSSLDCYRYCPKRHRLQLPSQVCSRMSWPVGDVGSTPCRNMSTRLQGCIRLARWKAGIGLWSISHNTTKLLTSATVT